MRTKHIVFAIAAAVLFAGQALADVEPVGCHPTSTAARSACQNQTRDDFWISVGKCRNVPDNAAREVCVDTADDALAEAQKECGAQFKLRETICAALGQAPYDPQIDPAKFLSPKQAAAKPNRYFPLIPGRTLVYQGPGEIITVKFTNRTKKILGVTTTVVDDLVVDDKGQVLEETQDFYAQHVDGTVWYFGEITRKFTEAGLFAADGSFIAGVDGAKAGIIMKAAPKVGDLYRQEFSLANAEDAAQVVGTTGTEKVPAASCRGTCLVTREVTALRTSDVASKYYAPGIGEILVIESAGERFELVSVTNGR